MILKMATFKKFPKVIKFQIFTNSNKSLTFPKGGLIPLFGTFQMHEHLKNSLCQSQCQSQFQKIKKSPKFKMQTILTFQGGGEISEIFGMYTMLKDISTNSGQLTQKLRKIAHFQCFCTFLGPEILINGENMQN